jgi:UDP-N-acetyl-D-galactosamine dehydrogenase
MLSDGMDQNNDVDAGELKITKAKFSSDPKSISESEFIIVAVPTPVDSAKVPDLSPLEKASRTVGENLRKGAIVVFESTVYPGVTEDICVPIIESSSNLKCGMEWKVGYSPERVNPGDNKHSLEKITKIVSGMDAESLEKIAFVYSKVTSIYKAPSIKVAEAAKVIENIQRDVNIALVNELSLVFKRIGIDTYDVLEAAGTKWNFLKFSPGLVGGHCIGVDPYYLTYRAEELGYHPRLILAGRAINDEMAFEVVRLLVEGLNKKSKPVNGSKILILGATFKENVKDIRNSKVGDIVYELQRLGAKVILHDPLIEEAKFEHSTIPITPLEKVGQVDGVILAVPHAKFSELTLDKIKGWMNQPLIVDVKGILGKDPCLYRL